MTTSIRVNDTLHELSLDSRVTFWVSIPSSNGFVLMPLGKLVPWGAERTNGPAEAGAMSSSTSQGMTIDDFPLRRLELLQLRRAHTYSGRWGREIIYADDYNE